MASVPPRTTASWLIPQVDWPLGYWSVDDVRIAGTGEVTDGTDEVQAYVVRRASDGAALLTVSVSGVPMITWENSTTVLIKTRVDGNYQLIRRLGDTTMGARAAVAAASRGMASVAGTHSYGRARAAATLLATIQRLYGTGSQRPGSRQSEGRPPSGESGPRSHG